MRKFYASLCVVAAILAMGCLVLGIQGFLEERSAGKEYETLLNTEASKETELQMTESQTGEESPSEEQKVTEEAATESTTETVVVESNGFVTREDIDFTKLQGINPHIYAWIEVEGTKVDYPIVQHPTDNTYYLTHTIEGAKTTAASIYTEYYNSTDFEDHHTVIYGHNMKNGTMFRTLHNFEDYDFFEEHRDITIYMPDQTRHYKVFAAYTYDNRHLMNTYYCEEPESFQRYLDEVFSIRDMGAYIDHDMEVTGEDYIITLSTCVNSGNATQRYLVQAVLVSIDK